MGEAISRRRRIYRLLDASEAAYRPARIINQALIWVIVANVTAATLESSMDLDAAWERAFFVFELVSVAIFSLEYGLRVWVSVDHPACSGMAHWRARLKYMRSPLAVVDFLAVAPFYVSMFVPVDLRYLRLFRLLRLLKLTHHVRGLEIFGHVLRSEARTLAAAVFTMLILVFIAASMMYSLESKAQPEAFGSVFQAIWWAVVTMTTVGYGDVTPITVPGRLIGVVIMILGVGTVALPAGMLAARFSEELQARKDQLSAGVIDALRDGQVGARDRDQLERLREELDLPDEALQRIVDLRQSEVAREGRCPHCGKPVRIPETP